MDILLILRLVLAGLTLLIVAIYFFYLAYAFLRGAPFVPTPKHEVLKMLKLAEPKLGDRLFDLGSGDGRFLLAAEKLGLSCTGVEINPLLYAWSRFKCRGKKITILRKNLWDIELAKVDILVIYFFLPKMSKLMEKIKKEMRPGTKVISYAFCFPGWQPELKDGSIYLYIV